MHTFHYAKRASMSDGLYTAGHTTIDLTPPLIQVKGYFTKEIEFVHQTGFPEKKKYFSSLKS